MYAFFQGWYTFFILKDDSITFSVLNHSVWFRLFQELKASQIRLLIIYKLAMESEYCFRYLTKNIYKVSTSFFGYSGALTSQNRINLCYVPVYVLYVTNFMRQLCQKYKSRPTKLYTSVIYMYKVYFEWNVIRLHKSFNFLKNWKWWKYGVRYYIEWPLYEK